MYVYMYICIYLYTVFLLVWGRNERALGGSHQCEICDLSYAQKKLEYDFPAQRAT